MSSNEIRVHKLDKEVLCLVPRPSSLPPGESRSIPLITVAGRKLHLYVLAARSALELGVDDGAKVIYGDIVVKDCQSGNEVQRGLAPERHKAATTALDFSDGMLTSGSDGAVFVRMERLADQYQGPYHTMTELPIANAFPASAPTDVQTMRFPFTKVDKLSWAANGKWDDFEFYNMTGIHIYFGDDTVDKVCHMQFWTLGLGETARFHIHNTPPAFCEIHCCITNGGGSAGMRWFADDVESIDEKAELTKNYVEKNTHQVVCPDLHEHGPLWKVQDGFRAKPKLLPNACADYPWHAWLASDFGDWEIPIKPPLPASKQRYDVWIAFEFPLSSFQY